ncbi:MAG: TonB-dependent receptor [Rhizomicrobium sp.]
MKIDLVRRRLLRTSAIAAAMAASVGASVAQSASYSFDIPSESLSAALQDVARVSGKQIIFSETLTSGKSAPNLHGTYTVEQAMGRLLTGSDLVATETASDGIVIHPKNAEAASTEGAAAIPETVVVTGTSIRGVSPAAPLIVIDRKSIDASGYSSVGAVLQTLPENFAGGQNPGVVGVGGINGGASNVSEASSANLRGIGSDSTLTLVDGHRLGFDGYGENVDLSIIPLVAVDHIEIVTDGSSAIYGSDAVAGVVNVVLRKDYDGADSEVTVGGPTGGGAFQQQYSQIVGKNFDNANLVAAYEYSNNDPLLASQRSFSSGAAAPLRLFPAIQRNSGFLSGSYEPISNLSLSFEGLYSKKTTDDMSNQYDDILNIASNIEQFSTNSEIAYTFGVGGRVAVNLGVAGYDEHHIETDTILGSTPTTIDEGVQNTELSADVEIQLPDIDIPTGVLRIAGGFGYRHEHLVEDSQSPFSRGIFDAFAEANVPLVRKSSDRDGLNSLDLDMSVRYEHYDQIGGTTNPKVGLAYAPVNDLVLKGTWGTSFRAPSLDQLHTPDGYGLYPGSIFQAPPGSTVLFGVGPSPTLASETSESWTATAEYHPGSIPGLSTTLTYYSIQYRDRIANPLASPLTAFVNPLAAPFVTLHPSAALQQALLANAIFVNNSGGPYDPANVYAIVQDGLANVSGQNIGGVDAAVSYAWSSPFGDWSSSVDASWLHFRQTVIPGAPSEQIDGTAFNPPSFKMRASLGWNMGPWGATLVVNHNSGEINNISSPAEQVNSWTTFDAQIAYRITDMAGPLRGFGIRVSAQNILDQDPPSLNTDSTLPPGMRFDAANASALGRTLVVSLSKSW